MNEEYKKSYLVIADRYQGTPLGIFTSREAAETAIGELHYSTTQFTRDEFDGCGPESLLNAYFSPFGIIAVWEVPFVLNQLSDPSF